MKKLFAILIAGLLAVGTCFAEDTFLINIGMGVYESAASKDVSQNGIPAKMEVGCTQLSINGDILSIIDKLVIENSYEFAFPIDNKISINVDGIDYINDFCKGYFGANDTYAKFNEFSLDTYIGIGFSPVSNKTVVLAFTGGITGGLRFQNIEVNEPSLYGDSQNINWDGNYIYTNETAFHTTIGIATRLNVTVTFGKFGINFFGFAEKELLQTKWTDGFNISYSPFYKLGGGASFVIRLE